MSFTVEWTQDAEDELTDVWVSAPDQQAVSDAANQIDRILARSPLIQGEEVKEGLRKLTVEPLAVLYEVDPARRHVLVTKLKRAS